MATESGQDYLRQLGEQYQIAQKTLPRLPEDEFERVRRESLGKDLGVGSFLMDFAISAETRRRNMERWAAGRSITPASMEHAGAVISKLPSYVVANTEAIGAMLVEEARSYRVDIVVEDILTEIAQRLPRKIDVYRYHQGYAHETLSVPGLGDIEVTMHQTGDGIFSSIGTVEGDAFRIWNCRDSGVKYMDRYIDISRPSEIQIKPEQLEINLYSDKSGIFVGYKGKRFTNARWQTAKGSGYESDVDRDDLYRTYSGPNDMAQPDEGYISNAGWRDDKTVLSWRQIEDQAIVWLAENVLNPLRQTSKTEVQEAELPEEEPFPEGKVGPLYAFAREDVLRKIALIRDDPSKAYPDERKAIHPGTRLLSLDISAEGVSEVAYDGYVWCGVGEINEDTDLSQIKYIGREYRWDDRPFNSQGVAVIKPKTATDVYVVDWQEYDNFRERTFTPTHDSLTDQEVAEMFRGVAKTLVPISQYDGGYKQPIVLIGRDLELDEVEAVFFPPEKK